MQQVGQRPADSKQWTTGTASWGQRSSDTDIDWTQAPPVSAPPLSAGAPGKVLWSSSRETDNAPDSGGAAKSGTVNATPSSKNSETSLDKSSTTTTMANLSASISWGVNSSTTSGLDANLWGAINTTSASTSSTWGSTTTAGSLSLNQGQSMQIGASSVGDSQNTNGSASAAGWGISPMNPSGGIAPDSVNQSQAGSVASNTIGQQSGSSTLASSQAAPLATSTMPWHTNKPFGFTTTSDSSWTSPSSTAMNTTGNATSKEGASNIAGVLSEPGKMDLAASLANLAIDKTAPPPDWNAMKSGWNSSMDPSKLPVGAVGSQADLSFAQATQKGLKPAIGSIRTGMLSAKEEEIRRAINTNEGWGTRPVRQDTSWDTESSPKAARKVIAENPEVAPSNVWNNNNGTAIWESTREPPAPGWGGGAAAGGIFAEKDTSSWNMPPKPNMDGNNWGGGGANAPMMNNPMSDKSIGTWGGESQQSSNKLWGNKTETGSWNEPPPERNMTWGGQDTDVGTWEDPATAAARRIVSSSGVGPMGGNGGTNMGNSNMAMGSSNMAMGSSNMPMGSSNMPMGSSNMPMGSSNMSMGGSNMPMGGSNMPMGGGSNMPMGGGSNMPMGGGSNMPMGGGSNMPMGGGSNMPMGGGSNMPMGGNNMPMGSGSMPMGPNTIMGGTNLGMAGPNTMPMGGPSNMTMGGANMPMNMAMAGGGGMNMNMGAGNNMNMSMGTSSNMNMGGNNMGGSGDPSMYWNDPNVKPQGWNQAGGPPRPKPDEPWNKPNMGRTNSTNGWGDPSGGSSQKVDDGTSIWAANAQEQARAAGWGEPGAMWNPAFGARPKATSWAGGEQDNWQRKLQGQQRFPGSGGQPQMRSKLIQQLMDMGFKKEEAQNALISNNMNFESALGELTSGLHKKEPDNDVFQSSGSKMLRQGFMGENSGMMGEDISDNRADSNPHVPNFPMQNTPFNNAQATNPSYMSAGMNMYDRSKAGPPMPPTNNGSLNSNLQNKLKVMQQQQQQQGAGSSATPALNSLSPGQMRSGTVPGSSNQSMVQQQAAQQQILQQLRLAVQSGLISPQLLNYQLPHNILVMLQQLLQLQNALQNLIQRQQFLQQNKVTLNIPRPQLDQVSVMIGQYKSQILGLQKQLQAAQQNMLMKQQPPSAPTPTPPQIQAMSQQPPIGMPPPIPTSVQGDGGESMLSLPGDMSTLAGGTSSATSMSRLSQWKQPTPEREGPGDLNKAPGSKPLQGLQHSHSTPTIGPFGDLAGLNIGGDTTWSSTATSTASNWPSAPTGDNGAGEGSKGEDGTPSATPGLAAMLGGGGNLGLSTDVIPEFVPGKPWQGLSSKSVEDDPHITPGSISRSLSVNVVKDDYLNNLTAANKSSPSFSTDAAWSTGDKPSNSGVAETSMASAMTLGASNLQAQQNRAGMANSNQWQQPGGIYNRQHSWAGRSPSSAFTQVSGSGWDSRQSSSWLLKNLSSPDEEQ